MHVFTEISILIALAAGVAIFMRALRQPLIIGHILTGILVGPAVLGLVQSPETIEVFASFGIALLLFIVGLGLNPKEIKEVGKVSLLTGAGQVVFTSLIGFAIVKALGYSTVAAIYISIALTFSSTIIILKLLSDKKDQNKLYGKISIGFLLVQDLIATFALLVASASGGGGLHFEDLIALLARGLAVVIGIYLVVQFVIKRMDNFLARSQELLFLFAIAWGLGIGALTFEGGFSLEVGALFAGVALSTLPYAKEISTRLRPLRDFFIVVFFITLGAKLSISTIGPIIWQALGLSAFVLIGNPIIVMIIMGILGYTKKTSFKAGLTVAQISEFSLIFILLGLRNGHVSEQAVTLVTIVGIITIALSSYMIIYSDKLYSLTEKYLRLFERKKVKREHERHHNYEAVLFGYNRGGQEFVRAFKKITNKYIVIDYDPEIVDDLERKQIPYLYGDATDPELLDEVGLSKAKLVVSTLSDYDTNMLVMQFLKKHNPGVVSIMHADSLEQTIELYDQGTSYVLLPQYIGTEKISAFIRKHGFNKSDFKKFREQHMEHLQGRYEDELEPEPEEGKS